LHRDSIVATSAARIARNGRGEGDNAETDFLLACLDDLTTPVRSKIRRGELGPPVLAETNFVLFRCGLLPFPRTSC